MPTQVHLPLRGILPMFAVLCLCLFTSASADDSGKQTYDLPAGDAEKTLKLFTQQSGEQILYPPTKVSGIQTNAVKGEMIPSEALDAMLAKTQLVAVRDSQTGAYTVQKAATVAEAEKNGARAATNSRRPENSDEKKHDELVKLGAFTVTGTPRLSSYE